MPLCKNYFISNTPCGVCMYFWSLAADGGLVHADVVRHVARTRAAHTRSLDQEIALK